MYGNTLPAELPDVIPAWVLEEVNRSGLWPTPLCDCLIESSPPAQPITSLADGPSVGWAVPGVTGLAQVVSVRPPVSPVVAALQVAVDALCVVVPEGLDQAQAMADVQALLALGQQLRVHEVRRVADGQARDLPALLGYRSSAAWLREVRPDGDSTDAKLGLALRECPVLSVPSWAGR